MKYFEPMYKEPETGLLNFLKKKRKKTLTMRLLYVPYLIIRFPFWKKLLYGIYFFLIWVDYNISIINYYEMWDHDWRYITDILFITPISILLGGIVAVFGVLEFITTTIAIFTPTDLRFKTGYKDNVVPELGGLEHVIRGLLIMCPFTILCVSLINQHEEMD